MIEDDYKDLHVDSPINATNETSQDSFTFQKVFIKFKRKVETT